MVQLKDKGEMTKRLLILLVLLIGFPAARNAEAVMIGFEDLSLWQQYNQGDTFLPSGIHVVVEKFYPVSGPSLSGYALVDDFGYSGGGPGKEIGTHNANVDFKFYLSGFAALDLVLQFHDLGSDINFGVNGGVPKKAADFPGLPADIDGAHITIYGYPYAPILRIQGNITSFTIGGQNVYIDNVTLLEYGNIPEPSTVCLLGLGSLCILVKRGKIKRHI